MRKFFNDFLRNPEYFTDRLFHRQGISCSDHKYFTTNGKVIKSFYNLIKLFGNRYSGKE